MTISFIIPSLNRASLKRTIDSIELWPGDEVLVEFDIPRSNMWGNPQRNRAMERAKGDYLAFVDDDDYYVPGHREVMDRMMQEFPDKPVLFRIKYPNGDVLWKEKEVNPGNVCTQMILVPNRPDKLYHWKDGRNMADFIFINNWKFPEIIWREEIIGLTGHDDGGAIHHV